jgi:hypothetical protein
MFKVLPGYVKNPSWLCSRLFLLWLFIITTVMSPENVFLAVFEST